MKVSHPLYDMGYFSEDKGSIQQQYADVLSPLRQHADVL